MADCPKCGTEFKDSSTFCNVCGVLLEIKCSGCDATNPASLEFCRSCGVELRVARVNEATTVSREPVTGLSDAGLEASVRSSPETPADLLALPKPGFWMRACAFGVDSWLLCPILLLCGFLLTSVNPGIIYWPEVVWGYVIFVIFGIYSIPLITCNGGTPGMRLLGLRVIRTDGTRVNFGRALGRSLCLFIPFVGGIGILAIAWNRNKQAWHDGIVGTYVVESPVEPSKKRLGMWLGVLAWIGLLILHLL